MAETLLPCPLCGSTDIACFAEECGDDYDNVPTFRAVVGCRGCREEGCDPDYDEEPCFGIEAYFRGDHPLIRDEEDPSDCERVLERHMAERWNRRAERTWHDFTDELPPVGSVVLCRGKNGALYVGKPVTFKGNVTRKVWVPRGDQYRTPEKWMEVSA